MSWKQDYQEACQYAKTVDGMVLNRKVDNETIYHILCLSVEKYMSSLASMLNYIPMHSGLTFVMRELAKKIELPEHFVDETKFLNGFMVYCSLDFIKPKPVSEADVTRMLAFLKELGEFTSLQLQAKEIEV